MQRVVREEDAALINDDCVAGAIAHLADGSVDLIVTDPPYGIEGGGLHRHYNRDEKFVLDGYVDVPQEHYKAFSHTWIAQAERVLRPGGQLYVVSGYTNLYDVLDALRATSLREVNHIIWKYSFGVYTSAKFVSSHYHILYYAKPGGRRTFNAECRFALDETASNGGSANYRDREDVWSINREYKPGREKNKNELPRALIEKMLRYSSNAGDLVADFFMGGGSTGEVALRLGRRFAGIEISDAAFDRCVRMLRNVEREVPPPVQRGGATAQNSRKRWSERDVHDLATRYAQLRGAGTTKTAAVRTLAAEFGRGRWSITKALKSP